MDVIERTTASGQVYEFIIEDPTDTTDGESSCALVILIDGVETKRRISYGIDHHQSRKLSTKLRDAYLEGFSD